MSGYLNLPSSRPRRSAELGYASCFCACPRKPTRRWLTMPIQRIAPALSGYLFLLVSRRRLLRNNAPSPILALSARADSHPCVVSSDTDEQAWNCGRLERSLNLPLRGGQKFPLASPRLPPSAVRAVAQPSPPACLPAPSPRPLRARFEVKPLRSLSFVPFTHFTYSYSFTMAKSKNHTNHVSIFFISTQDRAGVGWSAGAVVLVRVGRREYFGARNEGRKKCPFEMR